MPIITDIKSLARLHYDDYVPYNWPQESLPSLVGLDQLRMVRVLRVMYWSMIAKRYPPFGPFYSHSIRDQVLSSQLTNPHVAAIYREGTAVIPNALPVTELNKLRQHLAGLEVQQDTELGYVQHAVPSEISGVKRSLISSLAEVLRAFAPPGCDTSQGDRLNFQVRVDFSTDGMDRSPESANWHVDRFIPTLCAIYFPNGAKWGAFEKDIGDPTITKRDFDYFVSRGRQKGLTAETDRDKLYVNLGRKKQLLEVPENSLVVGTHHLQHRRSPITRPGRRDAVFVDAYSLIRRKDLLRSFMIASHKHCCVLPARLRFLS